MQSKMLFREIRSSLGRYLAIAAIIALGVGFFSGLRVSRSAMLQTCNTYLEEQNLYDYRLISTWGFEDGDAEAFLELDCVDAAAGAVSYDFLTQLHGNEVVLRAHSLTEGLNVPSLAAGRMPERADECVVDANLFSEDAIGSQLVIADSNDADTRDAFAYENYTIVGLVDAPAYLNFERGTTSLGSGALSGFVYLPREGFDSEYDTELYLSLATDAAIYSDAYQQYIDEAEPQIQQVLDELALRRYNSVYDEASDQIAEGEAELADGRAEYLQQKQDTQLELDDARRQLEEARQQLADARTELDSRYEQLEQLEQAERQYAEYSGLLTTLRTQLAEGEASYQENYAAYEAGLADYEQGAAEAQEQFAAAEARLAQSEQLLQQSSGELAEARSQLDEGYAQADRLESLGLILPAKALRAQLATAEAQYQEGMQALLSGQAEYNVAYDAYQQQKTDTERQLAEAKAELDSAAAQLAQGRQTLDSYAEQEAELAAAVEQLAQYAALAGTMRAALEDAEAELSDGQALYEENSPLIWTAHRKQRKALQKRSRSFWTPRRSSTTRGKRCRIWSAPPPMCWTAARMWATSALKATRTLSTAWPRSSPSSSSWSPRSSVSQQ